MKILIVGAGYVGLTSATVFANYHEVVVVDNNKEKINKIKHGENVISEPDLNLHQKKLSFETSLKKVLNKNTFDVIFLCVGTPLIAKTGFTEESSLFDLSMLDSAIQNIIKHNKNRQDLNLIIKSTVLPGTAKSMREKAYQYAKEYNNFCRIEIISNPEFLREGYAVYDVRYPSRIVVGLDKKSQFHDKLKKKIEHFYVSCDMQPIIFTDNQTAELSKMSANAFLANKVSFMNEQMVLAQVSDANINDMVKILQMDERIGKYINPGIGYGGYCLPKDVVALKSYASDKNIKVGMLDNVHNTNIKHMKMIVNKIDNFIIDSNSDNTVAIYGIAFKNNTRDSRESPAIFIAEKLKERNINVVLIDEKETLEEYKGSVDKGKKDIMSEVAIIANAQGYKLFTIHNQLKLVIDPLRQLDKTQRNKLKQQGVIYTIV